MKTTIFTDYTPEFAELLKKFGKCNWGPAKYIALFSDNSCGVCRSIYIGTPLKVTPGEFLDQAIARWEEKEKVLDFTINWLYPVLRKDSFFIGEREFSYEDLQKVTYALVSWRDSLPEYKEVCTESTIELRTYLAAICPETIVNGIKVIDLHYPYISLVFSSTPSPRWILVGSDREEGQKINVGRFINYILAKDKKKKTVCAFGGNVVISESGIELSTNHGHRISFSFEEFDKLSLAASEFKKS